MNYDPNYGEHAFAAAEVARDEQWLADMAAYDAEEQEREELTSLAFGLTKFTFPAMKLPFAAPLTESPF